MFRLMVSAADVIAVHRSAAMHAPGRTVDVERETLLALCQELLGHRALLQRLGQDFRTVARNASHHR
jgi:hypothetical protein